MTVATVDRPAVNTNEMGVIEAKGITLAIKENFDSLGSMLLQARDRKAYKALGYRSFDSYCKTEFGKSISHAYQLIEDVKVVAELEAEISKQYDEPVTLNFPSSHLRPLKEIPGVGDKLKAIEYAQKLAQAEGRTPTKKHLEIAVFEISGKRSEDFRSAIQSLGFTKGTQVEITKSIKQDRGFVARVDKKGKIYVELYNGGAVPIPYDATDLRILGDTEKPAIPANDGTANKGDKVKIFAQGLEGKVGEIYAWNMGKHAILTIDGDSAPISIAYAELELIKEEVITVKDANKWGDSDWIFNNNNYYYFEKENKIVSSSWPTGLTLEPYSQRFDSPSEFMKQWEERFKPDLIRALTGNSDTTSENELKALRTENQRLKEQLAEAEAVVEAIASIAQQLEVPLDATESTESLVENSSENSTPGDTAAPTEFLVEDAASKTSPLNTETSWLSVLESNDFVQNRIQLDEEPTETYRGWDIYVYDSPVADISHPNKGTFSTDFSWHREEKEIIKPLEWLKSIINQVEDFCPGQLSLNLNPEIKTEIELFPQEMIDRVELERDKLFHRIENFQTSKGKTKREQEQNAKKDLEALRHSLSQLEKFEQLKIGQTVWHEKKPEITGEITGFAFTTGGMPHVFVRWNEEESENSVISTEIVAGLLVSPPGL